MPDAKNIFGDTKWTLLQDNDPKHTSRKVQDYLHNQNIDMIDPKEWPANSPDLNPIENIWSILKQKISNRLPKTKESLIKIIKEEWNLIDTVVCKNAIDSMNQRLLQVIRSKGAKTKY